MVREVIKKKNWDETVRLADWVDPPPPWIGQENVKFFYFDFLL